MPNLTNTYNVGDTYSNTAANNVASFINSLTGVILPFGGMVAPPGWLLCFGQAVSRTTYATLFGVLNLTLGNPTITSANPGVVTLTGHGLVTGDPVIFTTTGALPTNIVAGTRYYAIFKDVNTFWVATTYANALAATKINTTAGVQSGVHTLTYSPHGYGDGSTTFNIPDLRGRAVGGKDNMGGTAAGNLTGASGSVNGAVLGQTGGEETHTLSIGELAQHTHGPQSGGQYMAYIGGGGTAANAAGSSTVGTNDAYTGGSAAHNNVQPALVLNYIICT